MTLQKKLVATLAALLLGFIVIGVWWSSACRDRVWLFAQRGNPIA
ncbi:hypothetical protein ULG90_04120 [Halopseudomonas pachastrellae]|nr:hypothetical protein ULG90_04120 [Halopseudomonas pachastrellae]